MPAEFEEKELAIGSELNVVDDDCVVETLETEVAPRKTDPVQQPGVRQQRQEYEQNQQLPPQSAQPHVRTCIVYLSVQVCPVLIVK